MNQLNKEYIAENMKSLQSYICAELEKIDGKSLFEADEWVRTEGGGGITRTIKNGNLIEKGGVAFSKVHGAVTDLMKSQMGIVADSFFATGVSIVLHPHNPYVPIIHMNVRYFELNNGTYWFGGGIDLTPHYIVEEYAKQFHLGLKEVCDRYNKEFYNRFKDWADDYFFLPHRNETRGVGGIFFDQLNESCGIGKNQLFDFCMDLGKTFPDLYSMQALHGRNKDYSQKELNWRNLRRGRYVEFNLVHDRGTKFGLVSNGRTESILMSLPPDASWEYNHLPEENSQENRTISMLKKGYSWIEC